MEFNEIQDFAVQAVRESHNIPNFGYHGDTDLGQTWGFIFSKNRDSDILDISNFDSIVEELESLNEFEEQFVIERCNHWACGWIEHLNIKLLDDKGKHTPIAEHIYNIKEKLDEYPIYNEEDYDEKKYEEQLLTIECYMPSDTIDDLPDDHLNQIFDWLYGIDIYVETDYIKDGQKVVEEACQELGFIEVDEEEDDEQERENVLWEAIRKETRRQSNG